jgi:hypothetical protein
MIRLTLKNEFFFSVEGGKAKSKKQKKLSSKLFTKCFNPIVGVSLTQALI